ncbi:mCG1051064 [Mus musculus]|nr:mCG1051064 [Mus musculus]
MENEKKKKKKRKMIFETLISSFPGIYEQFLWGKTTAFSYKTTVVTKQENSMSYTRIQAITETPDLGKKP